MIRQGALEVMRDPGGTVTFGWVGKSVFYSRFEGCVSAELGTSHAARLQEVLLAVESLNYFLDASAMTTYDLLARSAFTRTVLAHRRKFTELVLLTWSEGFSAVAAAMVSAIGEPIDILVDSIEFEQRLLRLAPLAKQRLGARSRKHAGALPRPPR